MKRLLYLLVFCFASFCFGAAPAYSGRSGGSSNSLSATFSGALTSGSYLEGGFGWYSATGQTITGVTDDAGQTWTQVGSTHTVSSLGGNWSFAVFRKYNNTATTAAVVTAALSASSAFVGCAVVEYTGASTTTPIDKTNSKDIIDVGVVADAATSDPTATTSQADEVVTGLCMIVAAADAVSTGTGFNSRITGTDGTFMQIRIEDKTVSSTGAYAATFTTAYSTGDSMTFVITLQPPAGGPTANSGFFRAF